MNSKKLTNQDSQDAKALENYDQLQTETSIKANNQVETDQVGKSKVILRIQDPLTLNQLNATHIITNDRFISIYKHIKRVYFLPWYQESDKNGQKRELGFRTSFFFYIAINNIGSYRDLKNGCMWWVHDMEKYDELCQGAGISVDDFLIANSESIKFEPKSYEKDLNGWYCPIKKRTIPLANKIIKNYKFAEFFGILINSKQISGLQILSKDILVLVENNVKQIYFIPYDVMVDNEDKHIGCDDLSNFAIEVAENGIGGYQESKDGVLWWINDSNTYDILFNNGNLTRWAETKTDLFRFKNIIDQYKL